MMYIKRDLLKDKCSCRSAAMRSIHSANFYHINAKETVKHVINFMELS